MTVKDTMISFERSRIQTLLLLPGILLVAANLRPSLTSVGPLLGAICSDTGMSSGLAGLLTTLPLVGFAALSPLAPELERRFGTGKVLFISLFVLTGGILLRSLPSVLALFAGTVVMGLAIAVGNVLLPGIIKGDFPHRIGLMTGIYTTVMAGSAAVGSGLSVPITRGLHLGWRGGLGFWALLSVVGIVFWMPEVRFRSSLTPKGATGRKDGVWRSVLAWQVTLFMGLQSLLFYVTVTWLPAILQARGMSAVAAGWMVSLPQFVGLPAIFVVAALAGRRPGQGGLVTAAAILCLAGFTGLLVTSAVPGLWVVLIGLGEGASISLALTFLALRTADAQQAAELSGMAQSVGYLLAAVGPTVFGFLRDLTGAWTLPLLGLVAVTAILFVVGLGAGRDASVTPTVGECGG